MNIGITVGDPAGIGIEVAAKAACLDKVRSVCQPILYGRPDWIKERISALQLNVGSIHVMSHSADYCSKANINICPVNNALSEPCPLGIDSAIGGKEAVSYLNAALSDWEAGVINAIATAPISKKSLQLANINVPGHTEYFAQKTGTTKYIMSFFAPEMRLALVTRHLPLKEVSRHLSIDLILDTIEVVHQARNQIGCKTLRIAVCGLNPHAGEAGVLGEEEIQLIQPAIERARAQGIDVSGPFPADTFFVSQTREQYDFIIAMYHDQGLIPFKMLAFEHGVNVTLGLPLVRTSVDHGTAFDIVQKGVAHETSMVESILLAANMAQNTQRQS